MTPLLTYPAMTILISGEPFSSSTFNGYMHSFYLNPWFPTQCTYLLYDEDLISVKSYLRSYDGIRITVSEGRRRW